MDVRNSILLSVKKALGIQPECEDFNVEIITAINTVFSILTQIGVGPEEGFIVQDANDMWFDFIPSETNLEMIRTYVYQRVRLIFDPPQNSFLVNALKDDSKELEWRSQVAAESG